MLEVNLKKKKIKNGWRPIVEILEARLWVAYLWMLQQVTSEKSRTMSWNMLQYTFMRARGHFSEINWSGGP